ncbi:MAG TPA: hybrid sensor histidine kinase/response regulator [Candidatus Nanopelagicaceae bacterium]|nr:hybrid sensor histidine kinase/response regulator [Candidatus Nanopelagicaceae bacterium]
MSNGTISVLTIEDNPGDARLIKEMLKEAKRARFLFINHTTLSGGLEELLSNKIDIILLDLNLPDCTGLDTISIIHEKAKTMPIIVLTGRVDEELAIESFKLGMQDYLVKGKIDSELLERSILYALGRQQIIQELDDSKKEIQEAFNRANFYKDVFAHDMSNILQGILSVAQITKLRLGKTYDPNEILDIIGIIENQIIRGSKLISNVRKLSELEEFEEPLKSIDICNLLKKAIGNLKKAYQSHNIEIKVDSPSKNIVIQASEQLLEVFENILMNAVKHNENSIIEILIKISEEEQEGLVYVKVEFLDNGIGIEDSRKATIFTRGSKENNYVGGMGIGLSLVNLIVERFGGKIWVEDRFKGDSAKGSNFIVILPETGLGE